MKANELSQSHRARYLIPLARIRERTFQAIRLDKRRSGVRSTVEPVEIHFATYED
jgi:hypothetical protein